MLTITKLGIGTAREYFQKEFANASNSYFSEKCYPGALVGQPGGRSGTGGSSYRRSVSPVGGRARSENRRAVDPASRYVFNA